MKTLFMETTKIEPSKTVEEIQRILVLYGASGIQIDYENREITTVSFLIIIKGQEIPFRLPCKWDPIYDHLQKKRKTGKLKKQGEDKAQAKRIAWRQILRWVEAQLALVDTGMVRIEQVFLSYMQTGINETLYDRFEKADFKPMLEYKK